jgi:hypothetical protein
MKITLLLTLTVLAGAVSAQEWTRFHGTDGSGVSPATGFPDSFAEKDFAWNTALPGPGISSPVLWGTRLLCEPFSRLGNAALSHALCR